MTDARRLETSTRLAGISYTIGNLIFFVAPAQMSILGHQHISPSSVVASTVSSIAFLCSGGLLADDRYRSGNAFSFIGALLLAVALFMWGSVPSAVFVLLLHALPKLMGCFPDHLRNKFGRSDYRLVRRTLGQPWVVAGFAPLITRGIVGAESLIHSDYLISLACLFWGYADWRLIKAISVME